MLIKCPECNKEISDKAKMCIYCGYPLDEIKNKSENSFIEQKCPVCGNIGFDYKNKTKGTAYCIKCGYAIIIDQNIRQQYNDNIENVMLSKNKCPKCGCTEFTPVRKKFSLLTGFATNKVELVCNNCGYRKK